MKRLFITILIIVFIQNSFALKPDRNYPYRPENFGLIYRELKVETSDSIKLNCWFFPAQETLPLGECFQNPIKRDYEVIDSLKRPTIIICSADAGNMAPMIQYAYYMCPKGYNVVTFDWRGFGESDNWSINESYLCYSEFFDDINSIIDTVILFDEVDSNNIGMFGFSMSAFMSFPVFTERPEIKCFIGRALATDLVSIQDYWKKEDKQIIIPKGYSDKYLPKNLASQVKKPCFLIVGELDKVTPQWMTESIYNQLQGDKEIWIVKNVGHGVEWNENVGFVNFINRMIEFYNKYL